MINLNSTPPSVGRGQHGVSGLLLEGDYFETLSLRTTAKCWTAYVHLQDWISENSSLI